MARTHTITHSPIASTDLQASIERHGDRILERAGRMRSPLFSAKRAHRKLMDWAMQDEVFKSQLFRFVDVLPALQSNAAIVSHLQEYLGETAAELSPMLRGGLAASTMAAPIVGPAVRANVGALARQFIAGANTHELCETIRKLHARGIAATVDLLGERVLTDAEARRYQQQNLEVLDALAADTVKAGPPCASDLGPDGRELPRVNLSLKISALHAHLDTAAPEESLAVLTERIRPILRHAARLGALINFDMENHDVKAFTLRLFMELLEEDEFHERPAAGIALQACLREGMDDLDALIAWARRRERPLTVRLVKGAYWDSEYIIARQRGWPAPVWSRKPETDLAFERMTVRLLENIDIVAPAFGTHNVRSIAHAMAQAEQRGIDPRAIEFQMLFGMADPIKAALRETGWRVREYCPMGELLPGMAYLVRRLLENTSNEGFMKRTFVDHADRRKLLEDPARAVPAATSAPAARCKGFSNEPLIDLSLAREREHFTHAIEEIRRAAGAEIRPVVNGGLVRPAAFIESINPARPSEVLARAGCASAADVDAAVDAARRAVSRWSGIPADARAAILDEAAELMCARRYELAAIEILEAGKPWAEADADVAEAIDFCRFYAKEMRRLAGLHSNETTPGEDNATHYLPRGVAVVIAPWNFPLAILCGMTTAALVTGNTVIMKPAEQTPLIAARLFEILREAGVPTEALHFLPGRGEEIGARLVAHPAVDLIAFTGSREVGLKIWETAGRASRGQMSLKKIVCEMGGKNALIIDSDADLDEAVPGALYSAFGFAGQKCSALSRLIVLEEIHDRFVERLAGCAAGFIVDAPENARARMGPVIDAEAQRRIAAAIEEARGYATLAWQGTVPANEPEGFFVPPALFTRVPRDSRLAREEIFGPVLAVFVARDLDDALALANDSEFALTGGIYSRSPANIERVRRELVAGNVYINRPITGAVVGRHPFGGYRMSGGGTKSGGVDYLQHFMIPRSISENTMRRGFAPDEI
ncbi:MAG: proline dehydrogenase family protein [Opitutaceae bacterium]